MCFLKEMVEVLECTVAQAVEKMNPEERDELKVSGKNADLKKKKSGWMKGLLMLFLVGSSHVFSSCFVMAKSNVISAHCHAYIS